MIPAGRVDLAGGFFIGLAAVMQGETALKVLAVVIGLLFGAMWRSGSLVSEGKGFREIFNDFKVSLLIGGANAVLTLALVEWLGLQGMLAMAIGVLVGATGLRAVPDARNALIGMAKRKLLDEGVALVQPPNEALKELERSLEEKRKRQ